ncbi:hypothetical protein ACVIGB_000869 [Bradyrhizobium sp. USDA 4341]
MTVAEAGREEFMPAVRLKGSELSYLAHEAGPEDPERLLFGYRGALWAPVLDNELAPVTPETMTRILKEAPEGQGLRYRSPFWFGGQVDVEAEGFEAYVPHKEFGFQPMVEPHGSAQIRKSMSSNLETRRADAQRVADSMRIVDGQLWFRCCDPVWVGEISNPALKLVFGAGAPHQPIAPWGRHRETFRADRLEDVKDWRRRYRHSFSKSFAEIREVIGEVEVLDGSFFRRDDLAEMTDGIDVVAEAAHAFMYKAPKEAVLDWIEFRDSASALSRSWSRPGAEKALADMKQLASCVASHQDIPPHQIAAEWTRFRVSWRNYCQRLRVRAKWFENAMQPREEFTEDELAALHEMTTVPGLG